MKILHVIPSIALEDGGPTAALERMANGLNARGASVTILTTSSEGRAETVNIALEPGIEVVSLKRNFQPYKVSWPALGWLRRQITDFDVVHIHAVFSFLSVRAGLEARRRSVPYIVRPLGVLNRWGMKSGRAAVKRLSYAAFESRVMKGASFIHFTSQHEADETCQLDPQLRDAPSFILPVPVSFNNRADPELFYTRFPSFKGRKILLFLSRFGPQKGIELVIQAFARLHSEFKDWTLVLAGGGERSYEEELKRLADSVGVSGQIAWVGYLSGAEKWSALAAADAFVLPSYSESFGIAAAEALVSGTPSILSHQIPFAREAAARGGARLVDLTVESVRNGMEEVLSGPALRQSMGVAGEAFARDQFTPEGVAAKLMEYYRTLSRTPAA